MHVRAVRASPTAGPTRPDRHGRTDATDDRPAMTDFAAVADWFEDHAGACRLYARQWLDAGAADDAVQEAFVRLMRLDTPPDSPRAWLFAAVRHLALTACRSDARRGSRERSAGERSAGGRRPAGGDFAASAGDAIDARLAAEALGDLPPRQREAVVLRLWGGLGYAEAASVAGVSLSTAHADYAAAIASLRRRLDPERPGRPGRPGRRAGANRTVTTVETP